MTRDQLMEEGNKLIAHAQALDNKEKSIKLACQSRSRSVPKNATISKEFVKCKKPNCYRKQHGPYYYAYWKDQETKSLRKKYIGRHFYPMDEQKGQKDMDVMNLSNKVGCVDYRRHTTLTSIGETSSK
jgi:hypothetical protein